MNTSLALLQDAKAPAEQPKEPGDNRFSSSHLTAAAFLLQGRTCPVRRPRPHAPEICGPKSSVNMPMPVVQGAIPTAMELQEPAPKRRRLSQRPLSPAEVSADSSLMQIRFFACPNKPQKWIRCPASPEKRPRESDFSSLRAPISPKTGFPGLRAGKVGVNHASFRGCAATRSACPCSAGDHRFGFCRAFETNPKPCETTKTTPFTNEPVGLELFPEVRRASSAESVRSSTTAARKQHALLAYPYPRCLRRGGGVSPLPLQCREGPKLMAARICVKVQPWQA